MVIEFKLAHPPILTQVGIASQRKTGAAGLLSVLWWDILYRHGKDLMLLDAVSHMHGFGGGGLVRKANPGAPGDGGPDRSWLEPASTIRADIAKAFINACPAKCAFIAANHRHHRVWWQLALAAFTVWFHFQHLALSFRPVAMMP
jgi:hypothetical protein